MDKASQRVDMILDNPIFCYDEDTEVMLSLIHISEPTRPY